MNAYEEIEKAVESGITRDRVCSLCSWTTLCVKPPEVTKTQIEAQYEKAKEEDEKMKERAEANGKPVGLPVATLVTALTYGGRDRLASVCPIFSTRLIESRSLSDELKKLMQGWTD